MHSNEWRQQDFKLNKRAVLALRVGQVCAPDRSQMPRDHMPPIDPGPGNPPISLSSPGKGPIFRLIHVIRRIIQMVQPIRCHSVATTLGNGSLVLRSGLQESTPRLVCRQDDIIQSTNRRYQVASGTTHLINNSHTMQLLVQVDGGHDGLLLCD